MSKNKIKHAKKHSMVKWASIIPEYADKFVKYHIRNRCIKRWDCNMRYLCDNNSNCTKSCSACNLCNELCESFVEEICIKRNESLYSCNGCMEEYQCAFKKEVCLNKKAHEAYLEDLIVSRIGGSISMESMLPMISLGCFNANKKNNLSEGQ